MRRQRGSHNKVDHDLPGGKLCLRGEVQEYIYIFFFVVSFFLEIKDSASDLQMQFLCYKIRAMKFNF